MCMYGIWLKKVDVVRTYYVSTYGSNTDTDTGVFAETYGYGYGRFVRTYAIETGEDCIQSSCLIYECYYIGLLLEANT